MTSWTNREASWKKSETKEESSFITHGLLGIIRKLHRKILRSEVANVFSGYHTVKMFEDFQREFEVQKSKAIAHVSRLQNRFT